MKKAQSSEMIGIVILSLFLLFFILFSKVANLSKVTSQTEESMRDYQAAYISASISKFPYIRVKGVSLEEMMAVYVCYEEEYVDYGTFQINISRELSEKLNTMLGDHTWRLELNGSHCLAGKSISNISCHAFPRSYTVHRFSFPLTCRSEKANGKIYIIS